MNQHFINTVYDVLETTTDSDNSKSLRELHFNGVSLGMHFEAREVTLRENLARSSGPMVNFTRRRDAEKPCTRFGGFAIV